MNLIHVLRRKIAWTMMPQSILDEMRQTLIDAKLAARQEGWEQGLHEGSQNPIPPEPPNPAATVLIGTHHKCGTVWMQQVFSRVAELTGRQFFDVSPKLVSSAERDRIIEQEVKSMRGSILFEYETRFPRRLSNERCRGLHLVRDPRDMIISAISYHSWADEPWLHEPRAEFGGLTYQQHLNEIDDLSVRQLFELTQTVIHPLSESIERMLSFHPGTAFTTRRYEDLIVDHELRLWHEIVIHLGFCGRELPLVMRAVWERSVFGDLQTEGRHRAHIQSGGETERWRTELTTAAREAVETRYGPRMQALGYVDLMSSRGRPQT